MSVSFDIPHPPFLQHFTTDFFGAEVLTPAEKACIEHAVPKRVSHFSTGRYCAKQALSQLGITDAELLIGEGKQPIWPEGIVGSISHSKNMAGAVVAGADKLLSIGLDIETIGGVRADMWDMLFLPSEQAYLNQFSGDELALQTTILFSGKEAFYKFQYPLTKTFLDFTDVEMNLIDAQFQLSVVTDFPDKELLPASTTIHYTTKGTEVITICYVEKEV